MIRYLTSDAFMIPFATYGLALWAGLWVLGLVLDYRERRRKRDELT